MVAKPHLISEKCLISTHRSYPCRTFFHWDTLSSQIWSLANSYFYPCMTLTSNFEESSIQLKQKSSIKLINLCYDTFPLFQMNNLFFRRTRPFGLDLETTSIERDREAGFAGFCDYMETLLGEPKINSWNDLKRYFTQEVSYQ